PDRARIHRTVLTSPPLGRLSGHSSPNIGKISSYGNRICPALGMPSPEIGSPTRGKHEVTEPEGRRDERMRRKLLVVDDDPYLTTQLRKLLETDELSVDTVSSAQEALTSLGAADYSVLITDLRMPGMGGMELIREVAQRRMTVTTIVTT